jgi:hypothetical protein
VFRRFARKERRPILQTNARRDESLLDRFLDCAQNARSYDGDDNGTCACKQKSFHCFFSGWTLQYDINEFATVTVLLDKGSFF